MRRRFIFLLKSKSKLSSGRRRRGSRPRLMRRSSRRSARPRQLVGDETGDQVDREPAVRTAPRRSAGLEDGGHAAEAQLPERTVELR